MELESLSNYYIPLYPVNVWKMSVVLLTSPYPSSAVINSLDLFAAVDHVAFSRFN